MLNPPVLAPATPQPLEQGTGQERCPRDGDDTTDDNWGDPILPKPPSTVRIAFQNIQGLPLYPYDAKHQQIISCIDQLQLDVFGLVEINLNFSRLPSHQQWKERFKGLRHAHSICSTNQHSTTTEKILFGGTAQLAHGTLSPRVVANGADLSGLGRWVWTRFIGKHNTHLRIISGYRPVSNTRSDRPFQVANQHETYLLSQNDDRRARDAFLEDLDIEIQSWLSLGDAIILSLDANDNVRLGAINRFIQKWGLVDAHCHRHPHLPTVATCSKNRSEIPIDGIWCSASVDILAAGYSGFGEYPIGHADHRLLWVDVSACSCFGLVPPSPTYTQPRRLTLQDPRVVKRYNKLLISAYERHQLPQRARRLYGQYNNFDHHAQTEYETLAQLDLQCRRYADRRCRKLRMGNTPFSDTLKKADQAVQLWLLLRKKRNGNRASIKKIRRLMRQTDSPTALDASLPDIQRQLLSARRTYKQIKRNANAHRKEFHKRLMRAKATHHGIDSASQERSHLHTERQRTLARRVRLITGRQHRTAFKLLDEPTPQGRRLCQDQPSIEQACMAEGRRRFTQSSDTPFLQAPLLDEIGQLATTQQAREILIGTYLDQRPPQATSIDEMTQKFIRELRRDPNLPDLPSGFLTAQAHRLGWQRMRSSTSSSPHGPGFIDYIAGCYHDVIAEFDATMSTIPFVTGYSPSAWSRATDVMIPKKADSIEVEKLRIIILYHALFNQANKNIGRLLIRNAEAFNQIPWEAYGSRRRHRAIECALNKVLTSDIWRQTRRPGALCSNDAKSCYDRIAHNVAILCMQRLGLSPETCQIMIGTLEQVQHHVRTTYGDSAASYCGIEIPLQGIGQGNGAGPAIWLVVSIPIINMLKTQGFGFKMRTPLSHAGFAFVCYTFVDDTDLVHSPSPTISTDTLLSEMQSVVDHWEGGLRASGGALVPTKSYWYLVNFVWRNDRWVYLTINDHPGTISIFDSDRNRVPLERLEVGDARETLGVFLALDGNQQAEFLKLRGIANRWCDQVRSSRLSSAEAWFALHHTVLKSLEYPLLVTFLTRRQCDTLMHTLLQAALPRLHIALSFPKVVRFGPRANYGLGIPHLWTVQGLEKILAIFRHGDATTIPGNQIRCSLEAVMIETGIPSSLFSYCYKDYAPLTSPSWISSLWEFLDHYGFILHDNLLPVQLKCEHDQFLIPTFVTSGHLTSAQLRQANTCRLWLRVWRLSDVVSGDGLSILPQYWDGIAPSALTTNYDWPRSERPSASAWTSWRLALTSFVFGPSHRLHQPLGCWLSEPDSTHVWFYSAAEVRLYRRSPTGFQVYTPVHRRTNRRPRFAYQHSVPHDSLPATCRRTTAYPCGPLQFQYTGCRPTQVPAPPAEPSPWALERLSFPDDLLPVITAIRNSQAFGLCDGSFKLHRGTAAFIIQQGSDRHSRILGCNRTSGHPSDQSSFRSELGGILGLVLLTHHLCHTYDIQDGGIELACDCLSALQAVFTYEWDDPQQPSYDIIHHIRCELQTSPITWTWRHVRGHQDQHCSYAALDWRSQLNVEMDSLAKAYWIATADSHQPFYDTSALHWRLSLGDRQFSSIDRKLLYDLCHGPPLRDYWQRKYNLAAHNIESIDWAVCDDSIRRLGLHQRLWLVKMNTNTAPTGEILHRRGHQLQPNCPRCGLFEDIDHVISCTHPDAVSLWHQGLADLDAWMGRQTTHPGIHQLLIHSLQTWHTNPTMDVTPPPDLTPDLLPCFHSQASIGWPRFLFGFLSIHWRNVQQAYFEHLNSRHTGFRWACRLFQEAIKIPWSMWHQRCRVQQLPTSLSNQDEHHRLNALIQAEYDSGTLGWRDRDRRWFLRPMAELFDEPLPFKQAWLNSVTVTRNRHHRRLLNPHEQEQQFMQQFFHPTTP